MKENEIGELSSISGRFYSLNEIRDGRGLINAMNACWRTKSKDIFPIDYIKECQDKGITDEFYPPQDFLMKELLRRME